jgi:hypothetical protein
MRELASVLKILSPPMSSFLPEMSLEARACFITGSASHQILMSEAGELVIFCHEEMTEAVDRRAIGTDRTVIIRTKTSA